MTSITTHALNLLYTSTVCRFRESCSTTVFYSMFKFICFFFYDIERRVDLTHGCVCEYYIWHHLSSAKISTLQPPRVFVLLLHKGTLTVNPHTCADTQSTNWSWLHYFARRFLLNMNAFSSSPWQGQTSLYPVCWLSRVHSFLLSLSLTGSLKSLSAWSGARLNKGHVHFTPESIKWEKGRLWWAPWGNDKVRLRPSQVNSSGRWN